MLFIYFGAHNISYLRRPISLLLHDDVRRIIAAFGITGFGFTRGHTDLMVNFIGISRH